MNATHVKSAGSLAAGLLLTLIAALALAGCLRVGPDYQKPQTDAPEKWDLPQDPALRPTEGDLRTWWVVFNDPQMSALIEQAGKNNLDLRVAYAKVKEAWGNLGVARGDMLPALNGTATYTRERGSENDVSPGGVTVNSYNISANASWEVDLFGRVSRSIEAAKADFEASEEDRVDVMISLYAEVAKTYLTIRATQAQLAIARDNIVSQKQVMALTQSRFENGLATGLDVSQAESVLASTESEIPPLQITLTNSYNSMDLLLAQQPGGTRKLLEETKPVPKPPLEVAVGVPADTLRQRPDVRYAERNLAAATARVGQATAELYPKFSLLGTIGLAATEPGDVFRSNSYLFSFGPQLSWNLFKGGAIRAQIQVQDAQTEQALLTYEKTVLNALQEVQSALNAYTQQQARVAALERTVKASRRTLKLAVDLYTDGLSDFQPVLDAERTLFQYDSQLAQARGDLAANLVTLYKSLGGGWRVGEQATAQPAATEKK